MNLKKLATLISLLAVLIPAIDSLALAKDWIALRDGTIIECEVAKEEDLAIFLRFKNGSIRVGREHVALLARESADEFVPADDFEKKQVEKGKVKFEGSWISKKKRDQIMGKRFKTISKKIEEIEKHKSWHHAYEIKTKSAIIKSNAPKDILDFYVEQWEAFVGYFKKDWKLKLKAGMKRKLPLICIYKDSKDYMEISKAPEVAKGFFDRQTEQLHIYHDRSDMRDTLETLFHEGTHLLTYYIEPKFQYPAWLSEGIAEYISANTFDGKKFIPGELQGDRLVPLEMRLEKGTLMGVEEMINLPYLSFLARGGYPPAWSFTHYLMENKAYKNKFKDFFLGIARGKAKVKKDKFGNMGIEPADLNDAFQRTFKRSLYDMQDEWHEHIRTMLSDLDAKSFYFKGMTRYYSGDWEGAKKDLQKSLEMGADLPDIYYLLGMACSRAREIQAAIKYMNTAIEMDPLNSEYYFGLGVIKTNYVRGAREEGKALLDLALEIDPNNLRLKQRYDYFFSGGNVLEGDAHEEEDD